jgi:hypothetical protein
MKTCMDERVNPDERDSSESSSWTDDSCNLRSSINEFKLPMLNVAVMMYP